MRSKASIKGHPIHPLLVAFPIAFFTGTVVMDLLSLLLSDTSYAHAAVYIQTGGLISSISAAIAGLIDYYYTIPPDSTAQQRATKHGLLNSIVVLIFSAVLALKFKSNIDFIYLVMAEAIGLILMMIAGWLGGTLVVRNQIGIDHRYADAGKWKEETVKTKADTIELRDLDSLKINQMKLIHVNGKRIVIARTENGIVAFDDRCTHRGGSLADGVMICDTVQCPWHGSQFNVKTGEVKAGPSKEGIEIYNIIKEGNTIVLQLPK